MCLELPYVPVLMMTVRIYDADASVDAYDSLFACSSSCHTDRPVIGVLAQPAASADAELLMGQLGGIKGSEPTYIAGSYVKWVEGAGARVLPIPWDVEEDELMGYFRNINGLLFTGGGADINGTRFSDSAMFLLRQAHKVRPNTETHQESHAHRDATTSP
eukprot:GFYU01001111.1.p2 GENE.GFYU01001111.1~~GFYU01001111.1.p2  ORF type:complete len:160 (-),score=28.95 GFYU01001111.1:1036-1515(-)